MSYEDSVQNFIDEFTGYDRFGHKKLGEGLRFVGFGHVLHDKDQYEEFFANNAELKDLFGATICMGIPSVQYSIIGITAPSKRVIKIMARSVIGNIVRFSAEQVLKARKHWLSMNQQNIHDHETGDNIQRTFAAREDAARAIFDAYLAKYAPDLEGIFGVPFDWLGEKYKAIRIEPRARTFKVIASGISQQGTFKFSFDHIRDAFPNYDGIEPNPEWCGEETA